jgi:amino acid permease
MQSTLRKPAVKNMRKALYVQYSAGLIVYYGVSIVGYWAYGSTVSAYLPAELSGPKWVKIVINAAAFLQSIVSQHVRF